VAQIAASIREFGFTNPVLVDPENNLIAGHGRVLAARKLGLTDVPAVLVTGLDDRKRRALIIADNKLALNAGWDEEALKIELEDLGAEFGDLMGFSSDELAALLMGTGSGETDPDAVPDVPVVPVTVPGDLWLLGSHKVLCGDSTMVDHVERLMGSERADACWTDPPYNVAYEGTAGKIKNDDMSDAKFREFLYAAYTNMFLALKMRGLSFRPASFGARIPWSWADRIINGSMSRSFTGGSLVLGIAGMAAASRQRFKRRAMVPRSLSSQMGAGWCGLAIAH
jgi:hypothetical protein